MTRYYFHGRLPNGTNGLVVAIDCADINAAYRILIGNVELDSFSRTPLDRNATWYGRLTLAARSGGGR